MTSSERPPATPTFGSLLRRLRMAAALSQEELAEGAGLSVRGIGDLERGVHQAPRLETVRLLADALRLDAQDRAALLAAARPETMPSSTVAGSDALSAPALPVPLTRLIGREREMAELGDLLQLGEHRLVTLAGPGGVGKTRLALAIGVALRGHFRDGVWFVDLSPLSEPSLVVPTIATALGVREAMGEPLAASLSQNLQGRHLLLVLDNCEHLLEAAPALAALLASTASLIVLATSREPLRLRGEREFHVTPLTLPELIDVPGLDALAQIPAVALFVERAMARNPEFALTQDNAAIVASISHRLDGLPLAIELAAARANVFSPAALLNRLDKRLPLLTDGGRDVPARQRTMRDAIAWSYDLLAPAQQQLFRWLAVFAGGFTIDSAAAFGGLGGEPVIFDGIVALVDHSLLRQIPGAGSAPRYLMLETVREFGLEQLVAAGEEREARHRHADYYVRVATDSSHRAYGLLRSRTLFQRLRPELDNVRLALAWLDEHRPSDMLLLTSAFWGLWDARGLYREGLRLVERALAQSDSRASVPRVWALEAAGTLAVLHGNYAKAAAFSDEELSLAQELGNATLLGMALCNAGLLASRHSDYGRAELLFTAAQRLLHDSDDVELEGMAVLWIGDMALVQEHFEQAAAVYAEALTSFQATDIDWGLVDVRAGLGGVNYCTGHLSVAAAHYRESLERARVIGTEQLAVGPLLGLAGIAAECGDAKAGARLYGAAERIVASLEMPVFPRDYPARDRAWSALTIALDDEALAVARNLGRGLSFGQAVAEAKCVVERIAGAAT